MCVKGLKKLTILLMCVLVAVMGVAAVSAATEYTISELDEMTISLPDDMNAITRSSQSSDKYFSVYGIDDYNTTMQNFENNNIYLQGMDSMSSVTVTVTMTKTEESESIGSYTKLSQDELTKIRNNFLNLSEYMSCTPDQGEKLIWFVFNANAENNGKTIKTYQANTVYDGMNVNIVMQRNEGNVTTIDYNVFSQIISSVKFNRGEIAADMFVYVIIGGTVVIVLLVILIIVLAHRIKKRRKHRKNDAILEELAIKYNLNDDSRNNYNIDNFDDAPLEKSDEYAKEDKSADSPQDIQTSYTYEEIASRYSSDDEIDDIINTAKAYKQSLNAEVGGSNYANEAVEIIEDSAEAEDDQTAFDEEQADANMEPQEAESKDSPYDEDNAYERDRDDKYANAFFGTDTSTEDEDTNDEELIRQVANRTKFDSGYDFFEEAPKKLKGVINSSEIKNASDYDVIGEEEEKAVRVQNEGKTEPAAAIVFLKKAGKGIKSFGVHFGYFCKNVNIMIKRKRAASKRRKAEAERRERERQRAIRARQRAERQRADGGLVHVHSRGDNERRR